MRQLLATTLVILALAGQGVGQARAEPAPAAHADWSVQCDGGSSACSVYAEIRLPDGTLFSSIEIRTFGALYGGVIRLPLGTHVPSGYQIGIDSSAVIEAELITCRPIGCEAAFKVDEATLNAFKRGKQMSVVFTRIDTRKRIALNYSLDGFTRVWGLFEALEDQPCQDCAADP